MHAPLLQVPASAGRAICPGTMKKRRRFRSVTELRVNGSEQPLQWHVQDTDQYDGDNDLKAISNSKLVLGFSYWLIFFSALCNNDF